jgi:site-specific recombinase XerD
VTPGLVPVSASTEFRLPALIAGAWDRSEQHFLEYFAVNSRNKNTRAAYGRAEADFLHWCEEQGIDALERVQPVYIAEYIELLRVKRSAPTVVLYVTCRSKTGTLR